jgi:predicted dinucleotide-binding enzyme
MRVAIIGAGNVGKTLGSGWKAAGHEVIYGSREPKGDDVVGIRAAVEKGDVVVLTTPWAGVTSALEAAGDFGGKPLVDVTNPIAPGFTLAVGQTSSGAEKVAELAKNARVVKAFNTTGVENMANPRYGARKALMALAGDDADANAKVAGLATDLGFEAVVLPSLSRARVLEPFAMLWIKLALQLGHGRGIAFGIARRTGAERHEAQRAETKRAITVVGTGNIGGALAKAWLDAGHDVKLAVRNANADDVKALAAQGAKVSAVAGAAEGADVVVLAVPFAAVPTVAGELGSLAGKVVIDCTNAIAKGMTLTHGHTTSSAEELAKALPGARVVRSFHQQGAETLENPAFGDARATNFVAADDADARAVGMALSRDVGLDTVDAGPLASARLLEPVTILWIATSQVIGTRDFGLTLMRR